MDKCRASYYLIEVEEPTQGASNQKTFYVVHLMQIITNHISDICNSLVSFKKDARTILKGTVRAASTTREFIEYKRKKLMKEQRKATKFNTNFLPYYLVKYSNDPSHLMFAVLPQRLVCWVTNGIFAGSVVLGGVTYQASILFAHDSESFLLQQLKQLKGRCSESAYSEFLEECKQTPAADIWLLVQFCFRPTHVAYKIVNLKETVYQEENIYKDLLAYLPYGDDIIQAIIIRRSHNRNELLEELQRMNHFSVNVVYPLPLEMQEENGVNGDENVEPNNLSVLCSIIPNGEQVQTPATNDLQIARCSVENRRI